MHADTLQALDFFHKQTGIKPIKARKMSGSMKGMISMTLDMPYSEFLKEAIREGSMRYNFRGVIIWTHYNYHTKPYTVLNIQREKLGLTI